MKIGIYTGTIPPPVFITNLINGLADKNDTVMVYGKASERNYKFSSSAVVQRKVPITKLGIILYSLYIHARLIIRRPNLYLAIAKMISQNSTNWIQFLNRSCRVFSPFLDNLDIFHIQWAKTLADYPEFIEQLDCPIILSLRGSHINYSPLANEHLANGYKKYFPKVSGFHAVSDSIARETEIYGADLRKITIIYPAVKRELISNKSIKKMNDSQKLLRIISVGRCHWIKGYTFALDAISILNNKGVPFHYTIIASGKDNENIHYQIHDLGLKESVTFINGLPHDEVIEALLESDLFLLPSLEEGISNAVLEAMALGIPVISTDCGGMGEVIRNGDNGYLVPSWDPNSMASAILNFINSDNNNKSKIVYNARETIIHNHLLSHQVDQFKSLYNSIV